MTPSYTSTASLGRSSPTSSLTSKGPPGKRTKSHTRPSKTCRIQQRAGQSKGRPAGRIFDQPRPAPAQDGLRALLPDLVARLGGDQRLSVPPAGAAANTALPLVYMDEAASGCGRRTVRRQHRSHRLFKVVP